MFAFPFEMKEKHDEHDIFQIMYAETCIKLNDIKTAGFLPIIKKTDTCYLCINIHLRYIST